MYPTAEIRWFYPGTVPSEVEANFGEGSGAVEDEPSREDHYLSLPSMDGVGIKLREGRIEIKKRTQREGPTYLGEGAAGVLEHWRKWSFPLAESGITSSIATATASWISVEKERLLRTYGLTSEKRVVPCSSEEAPSQGCEMELTDVRVEDRVWWTLAFEAFGKESCLRENLLLVIQHVLTSRDLPPLSAKTSCGYAEWLARIQDSGE